MAKLIYIESSPRKKRSSSIEVAKIFLEIYQKNHPEDEILTIDLWNRDLPSFNGDTIDAKYAILHGQPPTEAQAKAWKLVVSLIEEFKSGDKYVFSLPMWNFSIPYKLKHYIDLLVQPGLTFKYTPEEGYKGLVTQKKILLIYSRGGAYGAETGGMELDLQKRYMETILGFIGLTNPEAIIIEPTLGPPEEKKRAIERGAKEAQKLAPKF
jgi:FMN-dependent NADH-azoreductase